MKPGFGVWCVVASMIYSPPGVCLPKTDLLSFVVYRTRKEYFSKKWTFTSMDVYDLFVYLSRLNEETLPFSLFDHTSPKEQVHGFLPQRRTKNGSADCS